MLSHPWVGYKKVIFHVNSVCIARHVTLSLGPCHYDVTVTSDFRLSHVDVILHEINATAEYKIGMQETE